MRLTCRGVAVHAEAWVQRGKMWEVREPFEFAGRTWPPGFYLNPADMHLFKEWSKEQP